METKMRATNLILIGLAVLALGILAVWSTACRPPTPTVPPVVSTTVRPSGTPFPTLPPMPPTWTPRPTQPSPTKSTPGATVTPIAGTPVPTPTMTEQEKAVLTEMQHRTSQSASSADQCQTILATQPWCNVAKYTTYITRPEWKVLFPYTEFILVKYDVYGAPHGPQQRSLLIIEQSGQRYKLSDFQLLLGMNQIVVTDQNRELVAKAFVLMALPQYLEEEIVFSDWGKGDWPRSFGYHFNYTLTEWTKIQGLKIEWLFLFDDGLFGVEGAVVERNIGNYIDVPFEQFSLPSQESLTYWRKR